MIRWLKKFFYPVMFVVLILLTIRGFSGAINGTSYPILHHISALLNGATWALLLVSYNLRKKR